MQVCRVVAIAIIAVGIGASTGAAKTLRADEGPAEYPPASFTGKQYVDSRGCVYVRAGYAGQVTWVPRVSRTRKVLCGFKPSLGGAATASAKPKATAPRTTVAAKPKAAKTKPGAPIPTVALTETAPRIGAAAKRTPTVPRQVVRAPAPVATPKPVTTRKPVAKPKTPGRTVSKGRPACQGGSAVSNKYINDGSRFPVRCGPQQETGWGGTYAAPRSSVAGTQTAAATYVAPAAPVTIPKGYEPAWKDGRLNPKRGLGTARGHAQTDLIWTQTVPRRLIDVTTGRDVTRKYAYLRYPYTSYAAQRSDEDENWRSTASNTGYDVASGTGTATDATLSTKTVRYAKPTAKKKVVRTRAVATQKVAPKPTAKIAKRYVQVGSFGVPANAEKTRARLRALGLPVASGKGAIKGKPVQVIYAGPFTDQRQLNSALGAVRKAGYGDAFVR